MKQYILSPQHGFVYEGPKEKGSRFIGIVFQVDSVAAVRVCLDQVESRYPDATHRCYAYKIGSIEKSSDAGEPAGTAGKPILFALQKSGYDNALVLVVRYFGGTMLGAAGLVRAYGQCARDVLVQAPQEKKEVLEKVSLVCSYDDMSIVMQCMEKVQGKVVSSRGTGISALPIGTLRHDARVFGQVVCEVNRGYVEEFVNMVRDSSGGRIEIING